MVAAALTGVALVLAGQELRYRSTAVAQVSRPAIVAAPPELPAPLNTQALALAFGLRPAGEPELSQLALTLKASFSSNQGQAWALIGSAEGEAVYRVGDRLPGASVLRSVEPQAITVWFDGREQRLMLVPGAERVLVPSEVASSAARPRVSSPRVLREVP